ncbi:MAG: HAD family hydrolase [Myxococcales bacterium]|nr:HAD family hydrolase [Myxococcales bacterium]
MQPLLVVLDLDETLIYASETELAHRPDFAAGSYSVYKRPFLDEFLEQALASYDVAIWTSSTAPYALAIAAELVHDIASFKFIWARDRCTARMDPETQECEFTKNLAKLRRRGFSLERTIVVDDSPEKHRRNYGNLVRVTPFFGDPEDDLLPRLADYIAALASVPNVRNVEKRGWDRLTGSGLTNR